MAEHAVQVTVSFTRRAAHVRWPVAARHVAVPERAEGPPALALGEPDVDTQGITPGQKFGIRVNVLAGVVGKLGLGEADVDQPITEAEKVAVERGWNPPLAD